MTNLQEYCNNLRKSLKRLKETKKLNEKITATAEVISKLAHLMGTIRALRQKILVKKVTKSEKERSAQILEVSDRNREEIENLYEQALSKLEESLNIMQKIEFTILKRADTGESAKIVLESPEGPNLDQYTRFHEAMMKSPSYFGALVIGTSKVEEILTLIENLDFLKSD